ncbi:HTH-type transcriptional regulator MalT [Actinomadura sp. RB68]|uniref:HTH-type transcriptional regulator MalT n=2 Tax=Actinomadura macrotermitis TaxID=2585200 RepID=A0A7K0BLQ7_9ACTN|nr:HTH-type transcriptional regulator MalT [Actinomadura macrotermitis]
MTGVPLGKTASLPRPPAWVVPRREVTERLRRGTGRRLTVVTGPPGAGKTVAALDWASSVSGRADRCICWITCDETIVSVRRFCRLLLGRLGQAGVDVPALPDGETSDEALVEAIGDHLGRSGRAIVVVVDDFPAEAGSAPAEAVSALLRHAGPWLHIVVLARSSPRIPLQRYRLAGELTEIRTEELAFGEHETAAVLAQHAVRLPFAAQRRLREKTGGWPAGIRLAAMAMARRTNPEDFVEALAGDDQAVVDYLTEEVFESEPPQLRGVLLVTGITRRFNADLVAALIGGPCELFPELVRRNAFIVPEGDGWYRHLPMFAQAMRFVLGQEAPGEVAELHRRAAAWFERAGMLTEAVEHAAQAGEWHRASRMVVERFAVGHVLGLRSRESLTGVFDAMPDDAVFGCPHPAPAIVRAATATAGQDDRARDHALTYANALLNASPQDEAQAERTGLAVIELCGARAPRPAERTSPLAGASAMVRRLPAEVLDERPELRALAAGGEGTERLWHGELREAARLLREALTVAEDSGTARACSSLRENLALTEALLGHTRAAAALVAETGKGAEPAAASAGGGGGTAALASAWVHVEQWRIDCARNELHRVSAMLTECPDPFLALVHGLVGAWADLVQGRPDRALDGLRALEPVTPRPRWLRRRLTLLAADAHAALGDGKAARLAVERAGRVSDLDSRVSYARAAMSDGDDAAAAAVLRRSLHASSDDPTALRVDAWMLDAGLSYRRGDRSRGRRSLTRALRLAAREEIRRPFGMSRAWLRPVLLADRELAQPYRRLLEPLHLTPAAGAGPRLLDEPTPVERLSSRESDVLRRLEQMMTTEEIAADLHLSVNTVKTHLKSIYRKLSVTRRAEAVRRARRLSLL